MTIEEWIHQVDGTIQAVLLACTSMIATHPEKEKVLALLQALSARANDEPEDTLEIRSRKGGIRTAVATIAKGVETVRLATEIRDLKSSSASH